MANPTPEALETVAALLSVTGPTFDTTEWQHASAFDEVFAQIAEIVQTKRFCARTRCLLQDVLDLRNNGWADNKPKKTEAPMTLDQVFAMAQQENSGRNSPKSSYQSWGDYSR